MIKRISLIYKKPGISDEEFDKHWREIHGPLAARLIPGLRKYTQNHLVRLPGAKYEGDGLTELWFDDLAALNKFLAWRETSEGKPIVDDVRKFTDESRGVKWVVEEEFMK